MAQPAQLGHKIAVFYESYQTIFHSFLLKVPDVYNFKLLKLLGLLKIKYRVLLKLCLHLISSSPTRASWLKKGENNYQW